MTRIARVGSVADVVRVFLVGIVAAAAWLASVQSVAAVSGGCADKHCARDYQCHEYDCDVCSMIDYRCGIIATE